MRWVQQLVNEGELQALGKTRARRHYPVLQHTALESEAGWDAIPLAADSEEVLHYINLPMSKHRAAAYQEALARMKRHIFLSR